jgi:flotillin
MSGGKDGNSPTSANFLSGMLGSIPPFEELFKMAGMELPDYLKGTKTKEEKTTDFEEIKESPKNTQIQKVEDSEKKDDKKKK